MTAVPLTWEDWQARKRHSEEIARLYPGAPQLAKMHGKHGGSGVPGLTCAQCCHMRRKAVGAVYFKCALYGDTNGAGTDWRKSWPACGASTRAAAMLDRVTVGDVERVLARQEGER